MNRLILKEFKEFKEFEEFKTNVLVVVLSRTP